jgi:hypothetical protein
MESELRSASLAAERLGTLLRLMLRALVSWLSTTVVRLGGSSRKWLRRWKGMLSSCSVLRWIWGGCKVLLRASETVTICLVCMLYGEFGFL